MDNDKTIKVKRHPERGSYDKEQLLKILNDGLVCQVSFLMNGQPFVIPMTYYNNEEFIFIHGSPASRILNVLREGNIIAISVLELNGLVLAKGLADNSMNYRSAIIFGKPAEIVSDQEKLAFFEEWIDHLMPGRKENTALPTKEELRGVSVFRVKLDQFSVKIRTGGPSEIRKDPELWSGVVPLRSEFCDPVFKSAEQVPEYVSRFIDKRNGNDCT